MGKYSNRLRKTVIGVEEARYLGQEVPRPSAVADTVVNYLVHWWMRKEMVAFAAFLAVLVAIATLTPGASAQCDIKANLALKGYALPTFWDIAKQPTLQVPVNVVPRELIVRNKRCWNLEARHVVQVLVNSSESQPVWVEDTAATKPSPQPTTSTCKESNFPLQGFMHWACRLVGEGSTKNLDDLVFLSDTETHLLIDAKSLQRALSDPAIASAGRLSCYLEPRFSPWYTYYYDLVSDGLRQLEINDTMNTISWQQVGIQEEYCDHRRRIEEVYGADVHCRTVKQQRTTFVPRFEAAIPWRPCESYTNNLIQVLLPQHVLNRVEREIYDGESIVSSSRLVGNFSDTKDDSQTAIQIMTVRHASEEIKAFRADVRKGMFANSDQMKVSDGVTDAVRVASQLNKFGAYQTGNRRSDATIVHAYCEDAVWPHTGEIRPDGVIAETVSKKWLLYSKNGINTPSEITAYGWVPRNVTDALIDELVSQDDACSARFSSRLFYVQTKASPEKFYFQFDVAQTAPELVIASQRAARVPYQCFAEAAQAVQTTLKLKTNQELNTFRHACLGASSVLLPGRDIFYSNQFVDQVNRPEGCLNGQMHHTWTGVACGRTSMAKIVSLVQDTTPPFFAEDAVQFLPTIRHANSTHGAVKLAIDCAFPSDAGTSESGTLWTRIRGKNMFCLNKRALRHLQPMARDNCGMNSKITVAPAWRHAVVSRCPLSVKGDESYPHYDCEYLAEVPYKQEPFFNLISSKNPIPETDLCIDLNAWTQRQYALRITTAVQLRDACGNLSPAGGSGTSSNILYQVTFVNPLVADHDAARGVYCRRL